MKLSIKTFCNKLTASFTTLLICAIAVAFFAPTANADEPLRPTLAADIGPFVTMHYLDHTALNNYVDQLGMDKMEDPTLGYGLGFRILVGPVIWSNHIEGWSDSTSGNDSEANIWGLSGVGRLGFTLIRRTFLSYLYFGGGLDYTSLNINAKGSDYDFSGWKLGLLGDVGLSFEYLFPIGLDKKSSNLSSANLPIGFQIGYQGEMISDPWYKRTGELGAQARDRFMGPYIRFGINVGGGTYEYGASAFELPDEDDFDDPPIRRRRSHPEPKDEEPEEKEEEPETDRT